jgi:hypothetical protein
LCWCLVSGLLSVCFPRWSRGGARDARVRTGSDRAGLCLLSCRWADGAGHAGAGRAHSRCQQARNASFHGQSGLIFRTRWRACRARRAGMCQTRPVNRVGVPQVRVEARQTGPGGQVGGDVRGDDPAAVDLPGFRWQVPQAHGLRSADAAGLHDGVLAVDHVNVLGDGGCPGRRRSRRPGYSCR